ncbi:hypothetical protein G7Z17_g6953 [Cylindrodendrum hubeiense]|uniref:Uncharacterized protein n=1 Tax=Cylindrodendrum hubeiense TaxID=595255 RepID=A0A9P5HCA6_9HYPO|nr:hypothetical protein G7Z17_g6953 [Cylindrodendrum hubeiense]
MFRFHKTLDIVTLFHKASSPASARVASLLQKASANATAGAATTQATREQFELNITEEPPTDDQVKTILEYIGPSGIASVIPGATDVKDALRKFKESNGNFIRPVVVDWNNGKAIAGDNESEILKLLNAENASDLAWLSQLLTRRTVMAPPLPKTGGPPAVIHSVTFPRTLASDRPPNQQVTFTEFYPNGLPIVYKMLQTPGPRGVAQTYLEDYLPVGFYTNPKVGARAIFSTMDGLHSFRNMQHLLPQRRIHLWNKDEIQSVCNSIRKVFWNHMREMREPKCWDDLWTYFDASDLYHYGAMNLWNMVNTLFDENKIIFRDIAKETALHVGHWADAWITREENKVKLAQWNGSQGPLLPILTESDWQTLGNVQDETLPLIANALKHRRALLLAPDITSEPQKPTDLLSSYQNNGLENWLAGQKVFQPNGLPSPPHAVSHTCSPASKNAPAPVLVQNGNHYYLYPGSVAQSQSQQARNPAEAVKALHQSVTAAGAAPKPNTAGLVIANGSSMGLPLNTSSHASNPQHHQNTTLRNAPKKSKNKQPPPAFDLSLPSRPPSVIPRLNTPPEVDNNVGPGSIDVPDEYEDFTPTRVNRSSSDEWPNNSYSRNENFDATAPTPNRGGGHRNGPRILGAAAEAPTTNEARRRTSPNTIKSVGHQPPKPLTCRNAKSANNGEYVHCTCDDCTHRNCSVYVTVKGNIMNQQVLDIQTRIKFGLGGRFGTVVDVFPLPSRELGNFIVRFADEQSVAEALTAGGGDMPEKGISVTISPVLRSKWMTRPRGGVIPRNRPGDLELQQPGYASSPLGSPPAMNQPFPLAYPNAASVSQVANFTQNLGPNAQLVHGGFLGQPYLPTGTHTGFVRPPIFPHQAPYVGQHMPGYEQAQQQGRRRGSSYRETPAAPRAAPPKRNETPAEGNQQVGLPDAEVLKESKNGKEQDSETLQAKTPKGKTQKAKTQKVKTPKVKAPQAKGGKSAEENQNVTLSSTDDVPVVSNNAEPRNTGQEATAASKSDNHQPEPADNTSSKASPTLPADTDSGPCRRDQTSHSRVPSIFTDEEIKERRKAWARITMPIDPRKVKAAPANPSETADTKCDTLQLPKDSKVGNITSVSERSSPVQSSNLTLGTCSTPELSPEKRLETNSLAQKAAPSSERPPDETTMKALPSKPTKGLGGNHSKHRRGNSGRESRQSDRSGQESLSTSTSPHPPLSTNPVELHPARQDGININQTGEAPRKSKNKSKSKNKKKGKQGEHSQKASTTPSAPATMQAGPSKETSHQGGAYTPELRRSAGSVSGETSPQKTSPQVLHPPSPTKRPREESFQQCRATSPKRNKQSVDTDSTAAPDQSSTQKSPEDIPTIIEETRGRLGYRAGAGGSLRMNKQRKARPLVTEPSVAEQHLDTQVAPPSSDFAFECSSVAQSKCAASVSIDSDSGKRVIAPVQSRLNPKARDFQSPSRLAGEGKSDKADKNVASDITPGTSSPGPEKANDNKKAFTHQPPMAEDKKEQTLVDEPPPVTSASTETRKSSKSQKRDKGKDKVGLVEVKATAIEDKAAPAEKKVEELHTPNRAPKGKKAGLDKEDWPSLPPPRDRAASKSSTPSLWGTKKTCSSGQGSPVSN